jgi:hypothetical protein
MRFMMIVKATLDSEAGRMPGEDMLQAMADYHEELAKAGVLLDGNGPGRAERKASPTGPSPRPRS